MSLQKVNRDGSLTEVANATPRIYVGTQASWDALSSSEKLKYDLIDITDDTSVVAEGSPGHAISDETSEKTQRSGLKFEGFEVTDDSTNNVTKVADIPYTAGDKVEITDHEISVDETVKGTFVGTSQEWAALSTDDKAKYEIVTLTDDATAPSVVVDTVADGNMNAVTSNAVYDFAAYKSIEIVTDGIKTYSQLLDDLFADILSANALSIDSRLIVSGTVVAYTSFISEGVGINFTRSFIASSNICMAEYDLRASNSAYMEYRTSYSNYSNTVPASGYTFVYQYKI